MDNILYLTFMHLYLSAFAVLLSTFVGVPLGIFLERHRQFAAPVMAVTEIIQTIPGLAFLALVMMLTGLGNTTLVIVLFFYSLMPIVRNTYVGIAGIAPDLVEAGKGMGMTATELLRQVQLPLAVPVIFTGVRVALVTAVGTTSMGVFVGASGLGIPLYRGIQTLNTKLLVAGAIPAALLAVVTDYGMIWMQRALTPRGLRLAPKG